MRARPADLPMDYQLIIRKPWNYRHPKRGRETLAAGCYRVPEDVSDVIASRAIGEGMAARREVPKASPIAPAGAEAPPQTDRPRRKTPAPRNKSRGRAPEDKSTLV